MTMKRTTVDGKVVNERTAHMIKCAENRLGYDLYVVQGSYNAGGVAASAGTHDGGGAIDVSPTSNPNEVVRALREVGFAAWHRLPNQGPWNEHIHAIAIGDPELSSGARTQVSEYYAGQNGLANHAKDDGPRLNPIPTWKIKFPTVLYLVVARQFKTKKPSKKYSVVYVQKALKGRGYYHADTDGVVGPKTKKAFKDFQAKRGYKADGVVTRKIIRVLCKGYNKVL